VEHVEQLSKALQLVSLLNSKGRVDSRTLAEEIGVSVRTAQRYLQELSRIIPIQVETRNRKNEYFLMENYSFKDSMISNSEMNIVSSLIDYARNFVSDDHAGLLDVIKHKIFHANTCSQPYYIIKDDAVDIEKVSKTRSLLDGMVFRQRVIDFFYRRKNKRYTVEPYKIVFAEGFWYLLASHEEKIKTFLLDYIEDITQTGDYYARVPENLLKSLDKQRNIWFSEEEKKEVVVEIGLEVVEYFKRRKFLFGQQIVEEKDNGNIIVKFYASGEQDFFHQIIRWFPHFKVQSPDGYREFVAGKVDDFFQMNSM
jgi:predicted DNA-binding transcriptional regulator YafY